MCCGNGPVMRPCLECGEPAKGTRCKDCERALEKLRSLKPSRQVYKDPLYRSYQLGPMCVWPGCFATRFLSKDHIVPISKGGTNDHSNLQTLCIHHNDSKSNKEI